MYEERQQNPVYGGNMYEPSVAPRAASGGVPHLAQNVVGDLQNQQMAATVNHFNTLADVAVKRYEFANKMRMDQELQQADTEFQTELDKRMAMPNGDPDGFYKEDGQLDLERLNQFVSMHRSNVESIKDGSVSFTNREENALYTQKYLGSLESKVIASASKAESQRIQKAFHDMYNNYMLKEDFASAAALADQAFQNHVMSRAEAESYAIRARKGGARSRVGGAAGINPRKLNADIIDSLLDPESEEEDAPKVVGSENDKNFPGDGSLETHVAPSSSAGEEALKLLHPDEKPAMRAEITADDLREQQEREQLKLDLSDLTPDEFSATWSDTVDSLKQVQLERSEQGVKLSTNFATDEPIGAYALEANEKGGMSKDDYKKMAYAVGAHYVDDPEFAGADVSRLKSKLDKVLDIPGLGQEMFPDSEDPEFAMQSFKEGIINNILSTQKAGIGRRVDAYMEANRISPKSADMDSYMAELFEKDKEIQILRQADTAYFDFFDKKNRVTAMQFDRLYEKYKRQYFADTGNSPEESYRSRIINFKDWFFKKNKGYDQELKEYKKGVADICRTAATEAVVAYRMSGGSDELREQENIGEAIHDAMKNVSAGTPYTKYRKKLELEAQDAAAKRAMEYDAERGRFARLKAERTAKAEEEKAREDEAKDRQKWLDQQRRSARNAQWKAEAQAIDKQKNPYRYEQRADLRVKTDRGNTAYLYVPEGEYEKMLDQLEVGEGEGVVCTINGKRTAVAVRPAKVKHMSMNETALALLLGSKKLSQDELRKVVNGANYSVKFKKK